ncbi:hypothetical protein K438DRAFT_1801850 [Mycena galopus ATCC 62051]|nr:hypothetical protein K438DRAFT_1801850 [Mycena galopus ATCC 62051]
MLTFGFSLFGLPPMFGQLFCASSARAVSSLNTSNPILKYYFLSLVMYVSVSLLRLHSSVGPSVSLTRLKTVNISYEVLDYLQGTVGDVRTISYILC